MQRRMWTSHTQRADKGRDGLVDDIDVDILYRLLVSVMHIYGLSCYFCVFSVIVLSSVVSNIGLPALFNAASQEDCKQIHRNHKGQ